MNRSFLDTYNILLTHLSMRIEPRQEVNGFNFIILTSLHRIWWSNPKYYKFNFKVTNTLWFSQFIVALHQEHFNFF